MAPPKKNLVLEYQPRRPRGRPSADGAGELEARLISVARQRFFQEGYGASTMDAIAKAARVSKTTLYSRFPTKQALFRAVSQDQVASWDSGVNAIPVGFRDTLEETLQGYGEVWLRAGMSDDFVHMFRLLFSESARFPELAEAARVSGDRGIDSLAGVVSHFAERDEVPCEDPRGAAEVFQATISGWVLAAVARNKPFTFEAGKAWLTKIVGLFVASRASW
jgi:AcrR family transcriptional regulator